MKFAIEVIDLNLDEWHDWLDEHCGCGGWQIVDGLRHIDSAPGYHSDKESVVWQQSMIASWDYYQNIKSYRPIYEIYDNRHMVLAKLTWPIFNLSEVV
jgi:hypothetical protein